MTWLSQDVLSKETEPTKKQWAGACQSSLREVPSKIHHDTLAAAPCLEEHRSTELWWHLQLPGWVLQYTKEVKVEWPQATNHYKAVLL